ncbi:hypothetical protein [sulfur-oxidizing endosymbiont of Gigantopelta aegis]|uniref:hypothetical protein n=1 Tax=sulfur-oxidizing endosymbiont of Gigantopelta aegis TaxID=2794934 RepID=UPI0018DD9B48|nr:hypothetical protein [sulfur-oxidizing endosymbiont of Gigantopelta aegis]
MNITSKKLPILLFGSILMLSFSGNLLAGSNGLQDKLQQCKQQFSISHDKSVSQEKALTAKFNHLKLMKEILVELNQKNTGRTLSPQEIQENLMVNSHLMEMMVTEDLARKMYDMEVQY